MDEINITTKYTRNGVAEKICGACLKKNMYVFGGYVRDKYILNLDNFNDLDIVYFSNDDLKELYEILRFSGYKIFINYNILAENVYVKMSNIIEKVTNVKIIGKDSIRFPDEMIFSIDFVKCNGTQEIWKSTFDCDFSCNLFYLDSSGVKIRYLPKSVPKNLLNGDDAFTLYRNLTLKKIFFIVTKNTKKTGQQLRLYKRASSLINDNWKMYSHSKSPFCIGTYKNIKLNDRTTCSICLEDFTDSKLICNTRCKHSFCSACYYNLLLQKVKLCPCCRSDL
jgi:hypothetical protein